MVSRLPNNNAGVGNETMAWYKNNLLSEMPGRTGGDICR